MFAIAPRHNSFIVTPHVDDDEDEDNHICPVCDGECACQSQSSLAPALPRRPSSPSRQKHPPLKIKLTVPQNLLSKRSITSNGPHHARQLSAHAGLSDTYSSQALHPSSTSGIPKRRGRPPKVTAPTRKLATRNTSSVDAPALLKSMSHPPRSVTHKPSTRHKSRSSVSRIATKFHHKPPLARRTNTSRKRYTSSEDDNDTTSPGEESDLENSHLPTFVPASVLSCVDSDSTSSALSSSSSSLHSSSDSEFDTDSSIEAEEEQYILAEESRTHEKARFRRELLAGEDLQKRRAQNDWVIRPRKNSVAGSDVEMEADSEATDDELEVEQDDEVCNEDDDETDGRGIGCFGLITGWSEGDESSFDADVFFANLSSDPHDNSSPSSSDDGGGDGDQSEAETVSETPTSAIIQHSPEHLPLEITEGWDGGIVFTNGPGQPQGSVDFEFEVSTAKYTITALSSSSSAESDAEMSTATEVDEDGYEQDEDGGEGDTTDDDFAGDGDDGEPLHERAMRLRYLSFGVSAINPMSTMSPTVSTSPRGRKAFDLPNPSDILSGRASSWELSKLDALPTTPVKGRRLGYSQPGYGQPCHGVFTPSKNSRPVIIDDSHKDIPSPHPRFPGRGRTISHPGRINTGGSLSRCNLRSSTISSVPSSISPPDVAPLSFELPHAEPINLDDVLDASFLYDPFDAPTPVLVASDSTIQMKITDEQEGSERVPCDAPSHWDSMTNLKSERELSVPVSEATPSWAPSGHSTPVPTPQTDYNKLMKLSPLSPMLWSNRSRWRHKSGRKGKMNLIISPVLLPIQDPHDCTPNTSPIPSSRHHKFDQKQKTRREIRRERKIKKKSFGPAQQHHNHQSQHYHFHQHHPNMKSRGSASLQRNHFHSPSSLPPLSI